MFTIKVRKSSTAYGMRFRNMQCPAHQAGTSATQAKKPHEKYL